MDYDEEHIQNITDQSIKSLKSEKVIYTMHPRSSISSTPTDMTKVAQDQLNVRQLLKIVVQSRLHIE